MKIGVIFFFFLFSINLSALDFDYSIFFTPRFNSIHNLDKLLDVGSFKERQIYKVLGLQYGGGIGADGDYPSVYTGAGITLDFLEQFTFNSGINTHEISEKTIKQPAEDYAPYLVQRWRDNFFIDEANLEWYPSDWLYIKIGQMLLETGNGDIISSYQTAINTRFELDNFLDLPLNISLTFSPVDAYSSIPPSTKTLLYQSELSCTLDFVDEIKLNFLHLDSKDPWIIPAVYNQIDFFNYLIYSVTGETLQIDSSGYLNWIGGSWTKGFAGLITGGALFFEFGKARYHVSETEREWLINSTGFLFDGDLRYRPDMPIELLVFVFISSGDTPVSENGNKINYHSFISILPLITRTNIFFNGGINSTYASGTFYSSGVYGLGVIAPGAGFSIDFTNRFTMDFASAGLWAYKKPPESIEFKLGFRDSSTMGRIEFHPERYYGTEFDFTLSYEIFEYLNATLEMDFFLPGDFYPDNYDAYGPGGVYLGNYSVVRDPVSQIIAGIDFSI